MDKNTHKELPGFEEYSFDISNLEVDYFTKRRIPQKGQRGLAISLIAFRGKHGWGSAGNSDALFIQWKLERFIQLVSMNGLIVDLRELDYLWGDRLRIGSAHLYDRKIPIRIIIPSEEEDPEHYKAFQWLDPSYFRYGIEDELRCLRTDIQVAYDEIFAMIQAK